MPRGRVTSSDSPPPVTHEFSLNLSSRPKSALSTVAITPSLNSESVDDPGSRASPDDTYKFRGRRRKSKKRNHSVDRYENDYTNGDREKEKLYDNTHSYENYDREKGKTEKIPVISLNKSSDKKRTEVEVSAHGLKPKGFCDGLMQLNTMIRRDYPHEVQENSFAVEDAEEEKKEFTLHQLARDGDVNTLKTLLAKLGNKAVIEVNRMDKDKMTPLHYAARYNYIHVVKLLVAAGADLEAKGEENIVPLHVAARYKRKKKRRDSGDPARPQGESVITYLVNQGASINVEDDYGQKPLHFAAMRGNIEAVKDLLAFKKKIVVDAEDNQNISPLHTAAIRNQPAIAKLLIEAGANLLCRDKEQSTPLHLAAAEGNLGFVQMLLTEGLRTRKVSIIDEMVSATDNEASTPLHHAVGSGHYDVARLLIENHADVNKPRKHVMYPLHLAAQSGDTAIVRLLVENNAYIDAVNEERATPLHRAAALNHAEVVKYLIDNKAFIDHRDKDQYTPLLIATTYGNIQALEVLLTNGADYTAVDKEDKTAIYMAAEENKLPVLEKLLSYPNVRRLIDDTNISDNGPLHVAAQRGFLDIVSCLLKHGSNLTLMNEEEQIPLHLAAKHGRTNVVRELISNQKSTGSIIVNDEDEFSNTALHLAARYGHSKMVKMLVDLGADVSARNFYSWTPLDLAAAYGWTKTCEVLLDEDAPVDPTDKNKTTPLHLASSSGYAQTVDLLLNKNANVTLLDDDGLNCLDRAIANNRRDVALVIINSPEWKKALRNVVKDPVKGIIETPLRKLIKKMPDVAERVFDRCLAEDNDPESWEYAIYFNYEFLDDMYADWIVEDNKYQERHGEMDTQSTTSDADEEDERLPRGVQPYSTDSGVLKRNHALTIMIESEREDLLAHPLVTSLLQHKWNEYGSFFYYLSFFVYCLFLFFITTYMVNTKPPTHYGTDAVFIEQNNCSSVTEQQSVQASVATVGIIIIAVVMLMKEVAQFWQARFNYLGWTNLIEWTVYTTALLLVVSFNECMSSTGYRYSWQWNLGAISILLSWVNLVLFIQKFPLLGIYVVMFTDVLRTFCQFFMVFFMFIVAFALCFFVLFQDNAPYRSVPSSLLKTSVMMIGEFEFDNLFNEPTNPVHYPGASYIIFVVFLIIMSILIMNLLVGLAVDDIKAIQDQAVLKRMAMQVELVLDVEQIIPSFLRRRAFTKRKTIRPNQLAMGFVYRFFKIPLYRFFNTTPSLSPKALQKAFNREPNDLQKVQESQERLQQDVRKLRDVVKDVKRLESMLKAIVKHQRIDWQEEDYQGEMRDDGLYEEDV